MKVKIGSNVSLDQLFEAKHEIEHHLKHIRHMQSVVVDVYKA